MIYLPCVTALQLVRVMVSLGEWCCNGKESSGLGIYFIVPSLNLLLANTFTTSPKVPTMSFLHITDFNVLQTNV